MITKDKLKTAFSEMVKSSYLDNFQREISDEELNLGFENLLSRMEEDLKTMRNFSEEEFERYMSRKSNELTFSPACIFNEIIRVIKDSGEGILAKSGKYKRLREMEIATRLCFAYYKHRGETLMIKAQDNPDIVLALVGNNSKDIQILNVEIMTVPEIAKEKFQTELPISIANFIKEKKFTKAYGRCSLIVCLEFNHMGLDCVKIGEAIQETKHNPYETIWLTFVSDQEGTMTVIQIFPKVVKVEYNLRKENLFY